MILARRLLLGAVLICLLLVLYSTVFRPYLGVLLPLPRIPGGIPTTTVLLLLFSLGHAIYSLGWRLALIFLALSMVISWVFEQVGVETGLVYGAYHYTDALGPKLGHVPFLIPIAWFMMIYPSYVMANLIADGRPTGTSGGIGRVLWLSLLSAVIMTAWDVKMDPAMSGSVHPSWVWEDGGGYFGVPMHNFGGWLLTTFTVYTLYRFIERRWTPQPMGALTTPIVAMALLAYSSMFLMDIGFAQPTEFRVIAPYVMGMPLLIAAGRLVSDWRVAQQAAAEPATTESASAMPGLASMSSGK